MKKPILASFILLSIAVLLGTINLLNNGFKFQTDLLSLLPESSQSAVTQAASKRLTDTFGDAFIFMFAGNNRDELIDASHYASELLRDSPFAQLIDNRQRVEKQLAYFQFLKQYRFRLLSDQQKQQLNSQQLEPLIQQAWQALYSPANVANIASITEDPLNLFNHYLDQSKASPTAIEIIDSGLLITTEQEPDSFYSLVNGIVLPGAFSLDAQQNITKITRRLENYLAENNPNTQLLKAGAVFHGASAALTAKKEITLIAGGSCAGILLLFLASFRSLRPLFFSLASIGFGCFCALVISQLIFSQIHLLTLVFGASLIGVAIDYALHYLTRATHTSTHANPHTTAHSADNQQLLRQLLPSLSMGLATSLIGYSSLFQAPLPGLQQMALFSIIGLAAAWLFVVALFPLLSFSQSHCPPGALYRLASLPHTVWQQIPAKHALYSLLAVASLALALLLSQGTTSRDIRMLHTASPELLIQQAQIEKVLPGHASNQFFLISQNSEQEVLLQSSQFKQALEQQLALGAITRYQLISDHLPASDEQRDTIHLLQQTLYRADGEADQFMATAGFDAEAIANFHRSLDTDLSNIDKALQPTPWLQAAPVDKQLLWLGKIGNQFTSIVLLQGVRDLVSLKQAASDFDGIRFVDTVADISTILDRKRHTASQLLLLAYLAIAVLLLLRYRQLQAMALLCVPLVSSLLTLALLSVFGVAISLFHVFALFLVLGLGMDYSIFLYESYSYTAQDPASQDHKPDNPTSSFSAFTIKGSSDDTQHCQLAILLSVITSCLSFGLLSLSSTAMISAFGITVLAGSVMNWLLVPLIQHSTSQRQGLIART